jgi:hypothetical protein
LSGYGVFGFIGVAVATQIVDPWGTCRPASISTTGTKGRLDCDDAVFAPKPNPKAKPAERIADCRFTKEEDERLVCYKGFAEKIPKF